MRNSKDPCACCDSTTWSHWRLRLNEAGDKVSESCDQCDVMKRPNQYDSVYKGDCNRGITTDPNIYDPDTKSEVPYSTPGEKAAAMKRLNIKQADSAERIHGARNETKRRTYG